MKYQKLLYFLQNFGRDPSSLMMEDYLTGLKNRRYFLQYLKKGVDWDMLGEQPLSLLMVDIDYFKRINDQYGSGVGDQVLVHVAKILKKVAGKRGTPALYAGDEFMILLPDVKKHNALIIAAELTELVNENSFFSSDAGTEIPITLSIGVATAPDDAGSGKELLSQVKNALYHAKQAGRNQYADAGDVGRQAVQYLDSASIVGRKPQFAKVNNALKSISDGISQFVIIDGATGMGKTSFLDVVHRNLQKTKLNTIRVSGVNQESFRPYYLVSYIVTELMNQREDKGIGILESMDEKDLERLSNILTQLGDADLTVQEIDEKQREAIFRSFIKFFVLLVEDGRLAVLIDDLDFSDPASLHLLRMIMREKSLVLFICGTATEESKSSPKTIPLDLFRSAYSDTLGIQSIEMTPLTAKDIEKHVKVIFPEIDISQRQTFELADISKGNPLFVEEMLRKMIADQKIVQSGKRWKVLKLDKSYFPKSLEDIIRNKILALDGDSQRFLDCASAFGESISLSMLTGVSEEKSAMVHDFLNRIIDKGILRSDFSDNDETVRFLSKSIQGVVYDGIKPDQKKSLHEQIGTYQEKLYQHNLLPSASFLAHHFKRSDNMEKAKIYEDLQKSYNQKIFNDTEVTRYAVNEEEGDEGGVDEIGDVPLSDESLKYIPKLLQSLLVAIRNSRLYPPDSKSVTNSINQLRQLVDKVLEDVERFSVIAEKNAILINGQVIPVGNFQSIAQKIIDFWDRIQLKCLTFVRGVEENELKILLERICRIEPKEITQNYWKTFSENMKLSRVHPRQIKYTKVDSDDSEILPETEAEDIKSLDEDQKSGMGIIQRILNSLMGAYSKLKLYPAHGPVAREAAGLVIDELKVFFEKHPVLNIARIESSLLVNGAKLDTSGFEAMAGSFVKVLADARLNSITFLNKVTLSDMVGFVSAASEASESGMDGAYWQEIAAEKQIKGILFDQRIYEIFDEQPGDSDMQPGLDIENAMIAEEEEATETAEGELDITVFPERLRDLFLSGDRKNAGIYLQELCNKYKKSDESGRTAILDIFDVVVKPEDWRPSASFLKFVLTQALPLFEGEVNSDLSRRSGEILFGCGEMFILFGDYTLGAWIFNKLKNFAGTDAGAVFEAESASDKPLDPKLVEIVIDDLKSEDGSRQQDAFQLLSSLGSWVVPLVIETVKRESNMRARRLGAELIKNKGNDAIQMLKKSLMNESRPEYRARMLDVVDSVTTDLMLELTDALSDSADVVRRSAFRLAERLNMPEFNQLLIGLASSDDPDLAVPAITSLGKLNIQGTVQTLISVGENAEDKEIVVAACRAMGQIADPLFVPVLENLLMPKRRLFFQKKMETAIRVAAVYAISQIKDSRVKSLLNDLADDPDYRIREILRNLSQ